MITTKQVDCRRLSCPKPVVNTKKALGEIDEGTVTVIVDNATSCENVKRFAQSQGYQVEVEEKEGTFYLDITKQGQSQVQPAETIQAGPSPSGQNQPGQAGFVIFITTNLLGTGDENLGEILMKAFLNTIWDTKPKPDKIIFMNHGVKLTTEGSDVLESLQLLEKDGIQIISCGTCLAYYNLTENLRVGLASNMYEIVSTLLGAPKIIKI